MQKWNRSIQWPLDNYVLRCVEEKFGPSNNSGNPMITLDFEVATEDIEVAGEKYTIAGTKIRGWYVTQVLDDAEKTANCQKRVFSSTDPNNPSLYELFGLDGKSVNPENPVLGFKGKLVHVRLRNKEDTRRKSPTAAQLAKGEKEGDVIVNPVTGQPEITNYPEIEKIYGLAKEAANAPY